MIKLREYQEEIADRAVELLRSHKLCYLAMECRTGKTLTALAIADRFGAKSVLMVSKVKALPSIRSDYELLKPSYSLDVINYESAHKAVGKYDLVILDEAHSIGSFPKPSKRAKTVKEICKRLPIIYLSGTPSPESFSQLYHQFWVSSFSPFHIYTNFYKWAKAFVNVKPRMVNGCMVNDYSDADREKIDAVVKQLFIDYTQEEAGFDAKIEEKVLTVPMSPWTASAIAHFRHTSVLRWNTEESPESYVVVGDTPVKRMQKIHQMSSGTLIDEDGIGHITDYSKALYAEAYFRGKKKAVFYIYQSELALLKRVFPKWTDSPEEFQRSKDKDLVFLGQVRSAREGVRLDTADALIFYNMEWSYLSYEQGRNRLSSKERTKAAKVYFLCSDCGIERDILDAVHGKNDFTVSFYKAKYGKV